MSNDYGIKLNIAAIFHIDDDNKEDTTVDVGLQFEDSDGADFSCEVEGYDIEDTTKEIICQFITNYVSAETNQTKTKDYTDSDMDLLEKLFESTNSKSKTKSPKKTKKVEPLSDQLDSFLKSL